MRKKVISILFAGLMVISAIGCGNNSMMTELNCEKEVVCDDDGLIAEKPVIYMYDNKNDSTNYAYHEDKAKTVTLKLSSGHLDTTYPKISETGSWSVTPYKDGTLVDKDNKVYDYLFWDGEMTDVSSIDVSKGYSVKGSETAEWLEKHLPEYGLNEHEINDFITYWLPKMEKNKYNTICFQTGTYTNWAKLDIDPAPDALIRVFVAWYPTDDEEKIDAPEKPTIKRGDFTVVEWGGVEVRVEYKKTTQSTSSSTSTSSSSTSSTSTTSTSTSHPVTASTENTSSVTENTNSK